MKAIVRGAVINGAGALLLGASLALSSATVVSSATRAHPGANPTPAKATTCSLKSGFCLSVENTGQGSALGGSANSGGTGVAGSSGSGYGVWATSASNDAIYGETLGGAGAGVYGQAEGSGAGVYGTSANGAGVTGESTSSYGIQGRSTNYVGVFGYSSNEYAAYFENATGNYAALTVENSAAGGYLLSAFNGSTGDNVLIDADADGIFDGYVEAYGGFSTVRRARDGLRHEAFGAESTTATIEDTGTARLEAGEGAVRFDSAFASTIDVARGYQVFLTPDGDTRGLYIAAKYEGGFIVRENERGRSSVYFDYRVVAHPYGASDARLPQAEIKRPPMPRLPQHTQPRQP